jgi:DNA-binding MarR family transcriptional regulator
VSRDGGLPAEEWAFPRPASPWSKAFADDLAFLFSKIGARSNKLFAEALEPLRLRPGHVAVLQYLDVCKGTSQREIVAGLWIDASSLVALLDEFEERGLAERRRNPRDRRASAVHLTPKGKRTLARALELSRQVEQRLLGPLEPEERRELGSYLRAISGVDRSPTADTAASPPEPSSSAAR